MIELIIPYIAQSRYNIGMVYRLLPSFIKIFQCSTNFPKKRNFLLKNISKNTRNFVILNEKTKAFCLVHLYPSNLNFSWISRLILNKISLLKSEKKKEQNTVDKKDEQAKPSSPENELEETFKHLRKLLDGVNQESGKKINNSSSNNQQKGDQDDDGSFSPETMKWISRMIIGFLLFLAFIDLIPKPLPLLSFEKFKSEILGNHNLEKIKVRDDHTLYISSKDLSIYKMHMISLENFMKKLEKACDELSINIDSIPLSYSSSTESSFAKKLSSWIFTLITVSFLLSLLKFLNPRRLRMDFKKLDSSLLNMVGGAQGRFTPVNPTNCKVRFKDIKGCDDAKNEIVEFVEFLKNPENFKKMGAQIPKGAVLHGPPGTGKTLLAKAVAGEAEVPLFYASGSEFVEMFVGLGAKRIRQLFAKAKKTSPCIIFIDEIDAVGSSRSKLSSHSEHDQTLNQLLCELDGFNTDTNVVLLCGTNQFDKLDKALIRPGRLDRKIYLAHPDLKGRIELFELYLSRIKINQSNCKQYSERLAGLTPGTTGADIAAICNEAAILASRSNSEFVDLVHLEQSIDKLILGNRISKRLNDKEKRIVSIHEAGHAVVAWFLQNTYPLLKISIIPRGRALGVNQLLPPENHLQSEAVLFDTMTTLLGGRAAEELLVGSVSTGAQDDLLRVTQLAYHKVGVFGMDSKIGLVAYPSIGRNFSSSNPYQSSSDKEYGQELANKIDNSAHQLVEKAYTRAKNLIVEKTDLLLKLADDLFKKEVLSNHEIEQILGCRPEGSLTVASVLNHVQTATQTLVGQ